MPDKNNKFDASEEVEEMNDEPEIDPSGRHETGVGPHAGETRQDPDRDGDDNRPATGETLVRKNAGIFRIVYKFE